MASLKQAVYDVPLVEQLRQRQSEALTIALALTDRNARGPCCHEAAPRREIRRASRKFAAHAREMQGQRLPKLVQIAQAAKPGAGSTSMR